MQSNIEILERLLNIIDEKGYKPTPLVAELKMGQGTINHIRTAKHIEKNAQLRKICEFLGVNREHILTGKGEKFINQVRDPQINYGNSEVEYLKLLIKEKDLRLAEKDEMIEILKEKCGDQFKTKQS